MSNKSKELIATYNKGELYKHGHLHIVVVEGSLPEMGEQYGHLLKELLHQRYAFRQTICDITDAEKKALVHRFTELTKSRYPHSYVEFFKGMVKGSGMSWEELIFLDYARMFDMIAKFGLPQEDAGCAMISARGEFTTHGHVVVGRNFDWICDAIDLEHEPMVVAVYKPEGTNTEFATVGLAGWIKVLTGFSNHHLMLENNSGRLSVGNVRMTNWKSTEYQMNEVMLKSNNFNELKETLLNRPFDQGAICSVFGVDDMVSIEASPYAMRARDAGVDTKLEEQRDKDLLVSTNHFRLPGWEDLIPKSHDPYPAPGTTESHSHERTAGLIDLGFKHKGKIDMDVMKEIMLTSIDDGGATEYLEDKTENIDYTYITIVADMAELKISVCSPVAHVPWTDVDLKEYFSNY